MLAAGFGELAAQLGAAESGDPVASVHGVLAASPVPWLLLFDNASDRASVARFMPPAGPGWVLVTSRNQIWPPGQALDVPVLDPQVAAEFLVSRTGDTDQRAALELAGSWAGCRWRWSRPPRTSRPAGRAWPGTWPCSGSGARTCWAAASRPGTPRRWPPPGGWRSRTCSRPRRVRPGCCGCWHSARPRRSRCGCCCNPAQAWPSSSLPRWRRCWSRCWRIELAAGDSVAALRRYSLISPPADGLVSVHRLVQAVTVDQMPVELAQAWRQAVTALVETAIPDDTVLPDTWPACRALLPHAQATLADGASGMGRIAAYLSESGSYSAASDLARKVTKARERILGHEHPATLAARADLARCTGRAGDAALARDQCAQLLPVVERVFGPEHARTLKARAEFALWVGEAGNATGARDQFAALLPIFERILGHGHPDTLRIRRHIARYTGQAGDVTGAYDQLSALLPVYEQILGSYHPDSLDIRNNLATWAGLAGDVAGARDQLAALLPMCQQILGPEHPATLSVRLNLAAFSGYTGDVAGARDQLAALLPMYEQILGPEHPDTLIVRTGLARWARQEGPWRKPGMNLLPHYHSCRARASCLWFIYDIPPRP